MTPKLGDYTPSDSGPWQRVTCDCGCEEQHVAPDFGPKHEMVWHCWCRPVVTFGHDGIIVSHNVAQ